MSSSLAIQQSTPPGTPTGIGRISNFSLKPPRMQGSGYVQWQFLDQETNLTPYFTGTYLGTKKVFNVGAGFVYQPEAMWHLAENGRDTVSTTMANWP